MLKPLDNSSKHLLFRGGLLFSTQLMPRAKIFIGWTTVDSVKLATLCLAGKAGAYERMAAVDKIFLPPKTRHWKMAAHPPPLLHPAMAGRRSGDGGEALSGMGTGKFRQTAEVEKTLNFT